MSDKRSGEENARWYLNLVHGEWDGIRDVLAQSLEEDRYCDFLASVTESIKLGYAMRDEVVIQARLHGATWQQIGDAVGLPKQVVWRRYAPLIP